MASATRPVPEGYHTITPYLVVKGAEEAIDFYKQAFGAEELCRMPFPGKDGQMKVGHAELKIGDSPLFLTEESPDHGSLSPLSIGGTGVSIHLYVDDVDALFDQAVAAGATATVPPQDMFWGDRFSKLKDPFGHNWSIATHKEDVTPEEMQRRMASAIPGCSGQEQESLVAAAAESN